MVSDEENLGSNAVGVRSQKFVFATPVREQSGLDVVVALVEAEIAVAKAVVARSKRIVPQSRQDWGFGSIRWKTAWFKDGRGRKNDVP